VNFTRITPCLARQEACVVDQLIPSLSVLVEGFRGCFRQEVFVTFQHLLVGWILAPGPRTISEVWQATGRAGKHHWDTAYSLFGSASWAWDDLGKIVVLLIVARLIPAGAVWIVVDDTLCHKRGARVAFGGFFLDAVHSTKKKKNFRFGVNWVVVGLAVYLPFRPDRCFTLPVVWRAYRKKGTIGHKTRTELAAELGRLVAGWLPERECWLVVDNAYVNKTVLSDRPKNLRLIGPLRWNAVLYELPKAPAVGARGRPKKRGDRLPKLREIMADPTGYPGSEQKIRIGQTNRNVRVQVIRDVLWYTGSKTEPMTVVLVRDVAGEWRDEVLLATSQDASAEFVIAGYCRRWSIEVAFFESKQLTGLHDPHVWSEKSVERAHPMAWFVQTLAILWYATEGQGSPEVKRERPWYKQKKTPTFADMLGVLRLQHWKMLFSKKLGNGEDPTEFLNFLKNWLAAVR
jgi:DDE superfamily endonuclease